MASTSEETTEVEHLFAKKGCCCFWIPSYTSNNTTTTTNSSTSSSSKWWQRIRTSETPWWRKGLSVFMKVREWSELVAGPRWKTFIRRFNRNPRGGGGGLRGKRFQYDPLDYAMNFDEGQAGDSDGEYKRFSTRYAAPPSSAKSSLDLGEKDAPPLFAAG